MQTSWANVANQRIDVGGGKPYTIAMWDWKGRQDFATHDFAFQLYVNTHFDELNGDALTSF